MHPEKKKTSGPSGEHRQAQFPIREERPGQIEAWRKVARADGRTLVGWIRWTLDNAAAAARAHETVIKHGQSEEG